MSYSLLDSLVIQCDAELSAAYAHGMATGMLCINPKTTNQFWLTELLQNALPLNDDNKTMVLGLFDDTQDILHHDEFEFDLFLPDEDSALPEQIEAFSQWCRGFLHGVGSTNSHVNFSKTAMEILKDIAEFTHLDSADIEENADADFMELTEYVRAAVLSIRDEFSV